MSVLSVDPDALATFAARLDGLAGGQPTARTYTTKWVGHQGSNGLFFNFASTSQDIEDDIVAAVDRLTELLSGSAGEVRLSENYYRTTDAEQAAAADAIYDQLPG